MKHLLSLLLICSFFACKKKDAELPQASTVTLIKLNGEDASGSPRIVFGQYLTASFELNDTSTIERYEFTLSPNQHIIGTQGRSVSFIPQVQNKESTIKLSATDKYNRNIVKDIKITPEKADFRGAYWGQYKDAIERTENHYNSELIESSESILAYEVKGNINNGWSKDKTEAGDLSVYFMDNGKFTEAATFFTRPYTVSQVQRYVDDYYTLQQRLAEYSNFQQVAEWSDVPEAEAYKNSPEKWGEAIILGYLNLLSFAETSRFETLLVLDYDNDLLIFAMIYRPKSGIIK